MKSVARNLLVAVSLAALVVSGCAGTVVRSASKDSESKRQYLGLKKIAVMPFTNLGGEKDAELQVQDLLQTELNIRGTFEEVEDPRYVDNVLKALKVRNLDSLDLETVKKMGSEMRAQAILLGSINAWGLGEGTESAMHVSLTLTLMDTTTGKPLWYGSATRRASFTAARAFGLNEGPTAWEVAREVTIALLKEMDDEINDRREDELDRIKSEEAAKLKAAAEAEKRRLEEQLEKEGE